MRFQGRSVRIEAFHLNTQRVIQEEWNVLEEREE